MTRVVHFELGAQNPTRAAAFCQSVFGWGIKKWGGPAEYWLVNTGPEGQPVINGGIMRHKDGAPRTVNTVEAASIEDAAAKVTAAGGQVVVSKMSIPGVGYQAYCLDPEGVLFGIHKADPGAK